jgi:hypothetical protein
MGEGKPEARELDAICLRTLIHLEHNFEATTRTPLSFKRRDLQRLGLGKTWFKED